MIFIIVTAIYLIIVLTLIIALFLPDKEQTWKKPFVSVVVAARNEENHIGDLLEDLSKQTYPADSFEVIIVNDGSEDRTGEIIDSFVRKNRHFIHLQAKPDRVTGLTAKKNALNQGIQKSKADIILSTDADCHVKATWIETMVSYFTRDVGMVVGFSQFGRPGGKYSIFEQLQAIDFLALMGAAQGAINLGIPLAASGQNLAYRKQAFLEVGGFEKIKDRISGDDVLLLQLIHRLTNWKIRFADSEASFNRTHPEKTLHSFLNQRKRWASNGSIQLQLNKLFFIFISVMLLLNAIFLIGIPIYALLGLPLFVPLICLLAKIGSEFLMTVSAAFRYQRTDLIKYFPLWAVLQLPYVAISGFLGTFGHFKWKDRTHRQELTSFRIDT
ncbi:MAG: glycosyltransferase [Calditrichaeota bacterium]|nr:glycosyltransferase [Calditrichota bacterium]